jgi:plasmid stability protein
MSNIQIRNVPEALHRTLKARAALAGMSLSEYALRELERHAERPSLDELRQRLAGRTPVLPGTSPTQALAEERAGR